MILQLGRGDGEVLELEIEIVIELVLGFQVLGLVRIFPGLQDVVQ